LYKNAGIEPSPDGNSLEDILKIEKYLNDVQIYVIDALDFNNVIYKGKNPHPNKIYLLRKNHFDVITNMTGFLCTDYYCDNCNSGFKHKEQHKCSGTCIICKMRFDDAKKFVQEHG
jgi:hypothetical protein